MRKSAYLLFFLLPFLVLGLVENLEARAITSEEAWNPRNDPPISERPLLPDDPTPLPPVTPPPPSPIVSSCAAGPDEDFPLEQVRITFYTAKRENAGTQQPVYVMDVGGSIPGVSLLAISEDDSKAPGKTDPGSVDRFSYLVNGPYSSRNLSKMKISLGPSSNGEDPWFLGGLLVEGLKKGCDFQDERNWTSIYFNPFVRTWVTSESPLIVSQDDGVVIFAVTGGQNEDDLRRVEPRAYMTTPFERENLLSAYQTPPLNYPNTPDLIPGTFYYGRTYFSVAQKGAVEENTRFLGSFRSLSERYIPDGFTLYIADDANPVHFKQFDNYLIRPVIQTASPAPFTGYRSPHKEFWCPYLIPELHIFTNMFPWFPFPDWKLPEQFENLGETPSVPSGRGFFEWAIQYDNPGWNRFVGN